MRACTDARERMHTDMGVGVGVDVGLEVDVDMGMARARERRGRNPPSSASLSYCIIWRIWLVQLASPSAHLPRHSE